MSKTSEKAETLDDLIRRIQKEGIEQAEQSGAERIAEAGKKASEIEAAAGKKASEILARAKEEGREFEKRGRQSLIQAARDSILTVSSAIDAAFEGLARQVLKQTLDPDALRTLIVDVVNRYFSDPEAQSDVTILLSKDDAAAIADRLMAEFGKAAQSGISIGEDNELTGGFRVSLKQQKLMHDLSIDAMADLLCEFVRPQLAEITREALKTVQSGKNGSNDLK